MSQMTRSGTSTESAVTKRWPGNSRLELSLKNRSTPASRIVAIGGERTTRRLVLSRACSSRSPGRTRSRPAQHGRFRRATSRSPSPESGTSFYATAGACLHLKGPLGEGRLDDHLLRCPWHGLDLRRPYRPERLRPRHLPRHVRGPRGGRGRPGRTSLTASSSSARASSSPLTRSSNWSGARRAADERDFFQGLVHVTVAWYQAGRGNREDATGNSRRLRDGCAFRTGASRHRRRGGARASRTRAAKRSPPGRSSSRRPPFRRSGERSTATTTSGRRRTAGRARRA